MGLVTAHMSMSLDGFVAGPNGGAGNPLGDGGSRIQEWMFDLATFNEAQGKSGGRTGKDDEVLRERFNAPGAVVLGRRMFDEGEEPWGDEPPFHAPVFVLTHDAREPLVKEGGTTFTFVTDGVESALDQAKAAADDGTVNVGGGGNTVSQFIQAGLLDELEIHLTPVLFGKGVRLFDQLGGDNVDLELDRVVQSEAMTHLRYRIAK